MAGNPSRNGMTAGGIPGLEYLRPRAGRNPPVRNGASAMATRHYHSDVQGNVQFLLDGSTQVERNIPTTPLASPKSYRLGPAGVATPLTR